MEPYYPWMKPMPNGDASFFGATKSGQVSWWAFEKLGVPLAILVAIFVFIIRPWWTDYLAAQRDERADRTHFLKMQIEAVQKQAEAVEKLAERTIRQEAFEAKVVKSHDAHTQLLTANNELMSAAKEQMKNVPAQNEEKLKVLREIADGIKQLE